MDKNTINIVQMRWIDISTEHLVLTYQYVGVKLYVTIIFITIFICLNKLNSVHVQTVRELWDLHNSQIESAFIKIIIVHDIN